MRHGGWRNESCAKEYIEDSLAYKARTGEMIQNSIHVPVATSTSTVPSAPTKSVAKPANGHAPISNDVVSAASSSVDSVESFFESSIDNEDLVDIVDRASQNFICCNG